jgi:hypothetical protein
MHQLCVVESASLIDVFRWLYSFERSVFVEKGAGIDVCKERAEPVGIAARETVNFEAKGAVGEFKIAFDNRSM